MQDAADALALRLVEAVEGLGHEVFADIEEGERALDPLDDRGRVAADAVEVVADHHHLRMERADTGEVARSRGFEELHVEPREGIGAAVHAAVATGKDRVGEQFLRADEQRPVGAMPQQTGDTMEVGHVA